jgi:hypothetical protein
VDVVRGTDGEEHGMSSRPERFLHMPFPAMAMNAYYRTLIQGTGRSFNPLFFVLLPDADSGKERSVAEVVLALLL